MTFTSYFDYNFAEFKHIIYNYYSFWLFSDVSSAMCGFFKKNIY